MKIIQLSDWHIGIDLGNSEKVARKLISAASSSIHEGEPVAVCVCGDVIDKGSNGDAEKKYANAKAIVNIIKAELDKRNCDYRLFFVPGNHDVVMQKKRFCFLNSNTSNPFDFFCRFASDVTSDSMYKDFLCSPLISSEFSGINWILYNSSSHCDIAFGQVDVDKIQDAISSSPYPSVILIHHTLFSDGGNDSSALRNGYQMLDCINGNTLAILHGHTHGFKNIKFGDKCLLVGVGSFLKRVDEINKQVNFIDIYSQGIQQISNYFWRGDTNAELSVLYQREVDSYNSMNLKDLVSQIRSDVRKQNYLTNTVIRYHGSLQQMGEQINSAFAEEYRIAQEWQDQSCPDSLYSNHGQYIYNPEKAIGIEYVVQKLKDNPTCRRAMITLLSQEKIESSGDQYLPSFDTVQFSFPDETSNDLTVSLYMRALEVEFFLPVNLCELYILVTYLKEKNVKIKDVNLAIFAHRVTSVPNISGFRKAELDTISKKELENLIANKEYNEIIRMLSEKRNQTETVNHTNGIMQLKECMPFIGTREKDVHKKIDILLNSLQSLSQKRKTHSSNNEQAQLTRDYDALIKAFRSLVPKNEQKQAMTGGKNGTSN